MLQFRVHGLPEGGHHDEYAMLGPIVKKPDKFMVLVMCEVSGGAVEVIDFEGIEFRLRMQVRGAYLDTPLKELYQALDMKTSHALIVDLLRVGPKDATTISLRKLGYEIQDSLHNMRVTSLD